MIADAELFEALRTDLSALEPAHSAWRKGNVTEARSLLAHYFRQRQAPVYPLEHGMVRLHERWGAANPRTRARTKAEIIAEAKDALRHRFVGVYGIPQTFGPDIDWFADPTTQEGVTFQREWIWQFHRHAVWVTLIRAYELEQDAAYVHELAAEVRSWVARCPRPNDSGNYLHSAWRTIEAGIRAANTWPYVFFAARQYSAFDDDAVLAMVKAFLEHGRHLLRWTRRFNWKTMEANGLFHVGVLFPEFVESAVFASTGIDRLYAELDAQVYPDGMQMELSPSYHQVSLINFVAPVYLAEANNYELPREYKSKLVRMFEYNLYARMPDGSLPPFQDSNHYFVDGVLREAATLFPDHADLHWVAKGRKPEQAPQRCCWAFPYSGYLVMRSGWGEQDHALQFDVGPYGAGHQHEDKLNLVCHVEGHPFLVEGGCPRYEDSPWATYFRGTPAHNAVLVDGFGQNRRRLLPKGLVVKEPLPHVWEDCEQWSFGCARYDKGYGPTGHVAGYYSFGRSQEAHELSPIAAIHTRAVLFVKPHYWLVCDWVDVPDVTRTCELLWHLAAGLGDVQTNLSKAYASGKAARLQTGRGSLFVLGSPGVSLHSRLVVGQEQPTIQGWLSDPHDHSPVPAPTWTHSWQASPDSNGWVCTLIAPAAVAIRVRSLEAVNGSVDEAGIRVKWTDGSDDVVMVRRSYGPVQDDAGWGLVQHAESSPTTVGTTVGPVDLAVRYTS